ncbi:hypothetical protein R8Z50_17995 [Longispora sp. K20-0274]|uniref:hypothetical protein n=1 Tax=Longispora sp. K20-0274 TaxID=3088255 RepID=UPI00399B2960
MVTTPARRGEQHRRLRRSSAPTSEWLTGFGCLTVLAVPIGALLARWVSPSGGWGVAFLRSAVVVVGLMLVVAGTTRVWWITRYAVSSWLLTADTDIEGRLPLRPGSAIRWDAVVSLAGLGVLVPFLLRWPFVALVVFVFGWPVIADRAWTRHLSFTVVSRATGVLPLRPARFLEWARQAGLLRTTGAAYQFRHRVFQQWLAEREPAPTRITRLLSYGGLTGAERAAAAVALAGSGRREEGVRALIGLAYDDTVDGPGRVSAAVALTEIDYDMGTTLLLQLAGSFTTPNLDYSSRLQVAHILLDLDTGIGAGDRDFVRRFAIGIMIMCAARGFAPYPEAGPALVGDGDAGPLSHIDLTGDPQVVVDVLARFSEDARFTGRARVYAADAIRPLSRPRSATALARLAGDGLLDEAARAQAAAALELLTGGAGPLGSAGPPAAPVTRRNRTYAGLTARQLTDRVVECRRSGGRDPGLRAILDELRDDYGHVGYPFAASLEHLAFGAYGPALFDESMDPDEVAIVKDALLRLADPA